MPAEIDVFCRENDLGRRDRIDWVSSRDGLCKTGGGRLRAHRPVHQ